MKYVKYYCNIRKFMELIHIVYRYKFWSTSAFTEIDQYQLWPILAEIIELTKTARCAASFQQSDASDWPSDTAPGQAGIGRHSHNSERMISTRRATVRNIAHDVVFATFNHVDAQVAARNQKTTSRGCDILITTSSTLHFEFNLIRVS